MLAKETYMPLVCAICVSGGDWPARQRHNFAINLLVLDIQSLNCKKDFYNLNIAVWCCLVSVAPQTVRRPQSSPWPPHMPWHQSGRKLDRCLMPTTPVVYDFTSLSSRDWRRQYRHVRSATSHRHLTYCLLSWDQLLRHQVNKHSFLTVYLEDVLIVRINPNVSWPDVVIRDFWHCWCVLSLSS